MTSAATHERQSTAPPPPPPAEITYSGQYSVNPLGITPAQVEILTAGWSAVHTADLDVLRCYALHP
ncbi:hypothetical protein GCM10010300_71740 [Streptomyces olivaceoviridis]|uniref:hypothetical protein n=1 Tax=Streptomyces olivaceoviridis TaxID=1921 RepID=UPI001677EF77|nr:hypothetical protein [Streptomyces olivaceoviridis]GGZ17509.1 hypothetical protein GCM10010300_71740 [Streptomyces olivaceoviridis]